MVESTGSHTGLMALDKSSFGKTDRKQPTYFYQPPVIWKRGLPQRQVSIDPRRASAVTIALHLPMDPQWVHVPSGAIVAQGTQVVEELFEHPFLLEIGP